MFFSMGVSLFTSRIVLQNLGVDNYGIYTVIGGFVTLFAFFNGPLNAAASRFFAFEIGKGRSENLKTVFRSALFTHLFYGVVAVALLEIAGLYLLKNKLVIPPERMSSAIWVFHFSVIGVFVTIVQTPLTALIIATERMKVYAYLGIVDVVVKLGVAAAIVFTKGDKLVLYAFLLKMSTIGIFLAYHFYCSRNIKDGYSFRPLVNWKLQKEMLGFMGWTLIGSAAGIMNVQGVNILFNIFFGVIVNAAFGVANIVNGALTKFVQNFTVAINPQIIKSYASGDFTKMNNLIARGTKFSFFLFYFIVLPILFQTEHLLNIWLVEVPPYVVIFTKLLVIESLIRCFMHTIYTTVNATGDIMLFQIVFSGVLLLNLPVSYLFLKAGSSPIIVFYVLILLELIRIVLMFLIVKVKVPQFLLRDFISTVMIKSVFVAVFSFMPPFIAGKYITEAWTSFFVVSALCIVSSSLGIVLFGMNNHERMWFYEKIKIFFNRLILRYVTNN
jgi:O-antigen/teichoic acid export membrane protein